MARDRTAALAAAALLALGTAAGCGAGKSAAKPAASHPAAPPARPTAADLHARLLTLADMPPGFITDDGTDDANGTMSSADPACRPMTDLMNTEGHPSGALVTANTSFTRSQFGPNIATGLAGFATPEAAQRLLATVTEAMRSCTKLTETDKDGSTYDFLVAQLPFPPTGDASAAIRITADIDDLPAQVDLVLTRVGSTLLYVADTGFGDGDPDLTQQVVSRAVAKVEDPGAADFGAGPVTSSGSAQAAAVGVGVGAKTEAEAGAKTEAGALRLG
ncbi:sensor domain-containing protein [Catenulispora sp. NL8]|uniref:Sensor domain-containing protein n=1 Tax=Catenulispora pinistramenti TaxID=2705254 RepID=A0ABS5KSU7_9ACTN|nr:sensor domain-containing protein [Catenulispora pinistramenti]MBS2549122.1 sensor domain-containing protein [Catenulispora pinistramenti]